MDHHALETGLPPTGCNSLPLRLDMSATFARLFAPFLGPMGRTRTGMLLAMLVLAAPSAGSAAFAPYSVDAATLHLWHLDESAAPCVDSAPGGTNLTSRFSGATLGNTSFPGFGSALSTRDGGQGGTLPNQRDARLSALPLADGTGDNVLMVFANPTNGAFTFEAIVRVDFDPALDMGLTGNGRNSGMQIISGEGDETEPVSGRLFQWRLDPVGYGPGNTTVPRLEFINIHVGIAIQSIIVPIPTNGLDAIVSNQWYHVAVTYNGSENTADNISFFWTLLDTNRAAPRLIGTDSMVNDLIPDVACDFVIGNEGRATGGSSDNWIGLIDEVRISSVARSPNDFLFVATDSDGDGLPDSWEMMYFSSLSQGATNDPDTDLFSNLQEYQGGSNPTNHLSTPNDTDADGLPDVWENTYFSSLAYGPADDPDHDGFTNLQEFQAGTNPNNAASNPNDTDADGLPDAWEQQYFSSLDQGPSDDPDGDGYNNLEEYQGGSLPDDVTSLPATALARFVPVEDGDTNTSEYAYAGASAINAVSFICSSLVTVSNRQLFAYYGRHQTNPSYAFNNTIWLARRTVGSNLWEVFRTTFTANNINDGHDVVSFGIDGDGYLHMSWGMHGDAFHYAKSTNPVTGSLPIGFGPDTSMTGKENTVTYPQWLKLPDGDLLYLFREGSSGSGDTYLNRYDHVTQTWTNVHHSGSTQLPFIKGTGWTPNYNAYGNMPCLDAAGNLFLIWTWRYNEDSPAGESGYQTNHDFDYAWSPDGGLTWFRPDGTPYSLPISQSGENGDTNTIAEKILSIPEGYSLINQAGMCLDNEGKPVLAAWWAPGTVTNNYRRQYMVALPDTNGVWQTRQVSNRTNDLTTTKYSETYVRDLGRPVVVCDQQDRIIVLYRDNFGSNGLTIAHSLPGAVDPDRLAWTTFDLTTANLGNYEPVIDLARWQMDNVLDIVYQPSSGLGYTPPANNASQIGVLEWDAAAYFDHHPELHLAFTNGMSDAVLAFLARPSWGYRLSVSTNLLTWQGLATWSSTNGPVQYVQPNGGLGPQRFWKLDYQEGGIPTPEKGAASQSSNKFVPSAA